MMAQQYCKRWRHKLFHGHGAPNRISLTSDQSVEWNRESGDVWTNAESAITDGHGLMKLGKEASTVLKQPRATIEALLLEPVRIALDIVGRDRTFIGYWTLRWPPGSFK